MAPTQTMVRHARTGTSVTKQLCKPMDGGTRLKVLGDLKEGNRVVDVSFRQVCVFCSCPVVNIDWTLQVVVLVHEVQAKKEIQCKNGTMAALVVIIVMDDTCSGVKLKLWGRRADWAVSDGVFPH